MPNPAVKRDCAKARSPLLLRWKHHRKTESQEYSDFDSKAGKNAGTLRKFFVAYVIPAISGVGYPIVKEAFELF